MPGRPFAVVDAEGSIAGCHSSRESASIQMIGLNVSGPGEAVAPAAASSAASQPVVEAPAGRPDMPVMYTTPKSAAW